MKIGHSIGFSCHRIYLYKATMFGDTCFCVCEILSDILKNGMFLQAWLDFKKKS